MTAGMGGMSGAQPLAITMNEGVCLDVEVDKERIERRLNTGYCEIMTENFDEALKLVEDAVKKKTPAEWATYVEYLGEGTMPLFLLGWYPDYLDPDNYTWSWGHSEASDDIGVFYSNSEMDEILEKGQVATPLRGDERKAIYEDAQKLWAKECPTIPFTQGQLLIVAQKNVSGIKLDPTMFLHYFLLTK